MYTIYSIIYIQVLLDAGLHLRPDFFIHIGRVHAPSPLHLTAMGLSHTCFDPRDYLSSDDYDGDKAAAAAELMLNAFYPDNFDANNGYTTLHICARYNNLKVAKVLLSHGCWVDALANCGSTPLLEAIRCKRTEMVKFLIDAGADVNATDRDGWSGLYCAVTYKYIEETILLLQNGCKVDSVQLVDINLSPISAAIRNKNIEALKMMVAAGCMLPVCRLRADDYISRSLDELKNQISPEDQAWLHEKMHNPASFLMLSRKALRNSLGANVRKVEEMMLPPPVKKFIMMKELGSSE